MIGSARAKRTNLVPLLLICGLVAGLSFRRTPRGLFRYFQYQYRLD